MTPEKDAPLPNTSLDTPMNRLAVKIANGVLKMATPEYRRFIKASIILGLEAAKDPDRNELIHDRDHWQAEYADACDRLADVWDEGYCRGVRDEGGEMERADNPYREVL